MALLALCGLLIVLNCAIGSSGVVIRIPRNIENEINVTWMRDNLIDEAFLAQNCYRAKSGVDPLTLDTTISSFSQNWANHLASSDSFVHSGGKYGENLYAASPSFSNGGTPIRAWYKEYLDNNYNFQINNWQNSGHFTQLVWKGTQRAGFGVASSQQWTYFVADYDPPGNFGGEYTANVFEPSDNNLDSCVSSADIEDIDPALVKIL